MKKVILIVGLVVVGVLMMTLLFKVLSGEDSWICENGEWVKHGSPSAEMPEGTCD